MSTKASKEDQGSSVQKAKKPKIRKQTLRDLTPKDAPRDAIRGGGRNTCTCL